jgi:hypothetical protein
MFRLTIPLAQVSFGLSVILFLFQASNVIIPLAAIIHSLWS